MNSPLAHRIDRRVALKWMFAAIGAATLRPHGLSAAPKTPQGIGLDPDMVNIKPAAELWPLTFNQAQLRAATALCDMIIPADEVSPSASAVGVPAFIDEWISAPYPDHQNDKAIVLEGLAWIDAESNRRFGAVFADLAEPQKTAICDDLCRLEPAKPEFKKPSRFFKEFRDLTTGGFYTTPEGAKDIGYVGNIPLLEFPGPPPELLAKLGLD